MLLLKKGITNAPCTECIEVGTETEGWHVEQRDSPYQYMIRKFFTRKIQQKGREEEEEREILNGAPLACIVWISEADLALLSNVSGKKQHKRH
jgi:hypothetical protein